MHFLRRSLILRLPTLYANSRFNRTLLVSSKFYSKKSAENSSPIKHGASSTRGSSSSNGHEQKDYQNRYWAIASLTFSIPALYWIYRKHNPVDEIERKEEEEKIASKHHEMPQAKIEAFAEEPDDWEAYIAELLESADNENLSDVQDRDFVIIGAGAAAFSAYQEIRKMNPSASIVMIGEEVFVPYMRPPLSKELWTIDDASFSSAAAAYENDPNELAEHLKFKDWEKKESSTLFASKQHYHSDNGKLRDDLISGVKVVGLDTKSRVVALSDGRRFRYTSGALYATGGSPNMLVLADGKPCNSKEVITFRSLNDFIQLRRKLQNSSGEFHVVVIGGGFLGSELAASIAQYSKNQRQGSVSVSMIVDDTGVLSRVLPKYLSEWITVKLSNVGVGVHIWARRKVADVQSISSNSKGRLSVLMDDGNQIEADCVISATGISPNQQLAVRAGLDVDPNNGGVKSDEFLKVTDGLWVAGDVASVICKAATGENIRTRIEHFDHAARTGVLAGRNMVSGKQGKAFTSTGMFWSDLGPNVSIEAVGQVDSSLETIGIWKEADDDDVNGDDQKKRPSYDSGVLLYSNNGKIVGALMLNLHGMVKTATDVVKQGHSSDDVDAIAKKFKLI